MSDLKIGRAMDIHVPSRVRSPKQWGVRLLCAVPQAPQARRHEAPYMAISRFRIRVREVESTVSLAAEGSGCSRLEVARDGQGRRASQRR